MKTMIHILVCNVNRIIRCHTHRLMNTLINNDYWKGFTFISSLNQGYSNVSICVEECTLDDHNRGLGREPQE